MHNSRCASPLSPFYSSTFNFICDKSPSAPPAHRALVSVDEEPNSCRFNFIFRSPHCCPIYHPSPHPSPAASPPTDGGGGGLPNPSASPAAIALLVLTLGLLAYVGAGSAYKARVRGCQGLEALPHVDQLRCVARGFAQRVYRPVRRRLGLATEDGEAPTAQRQHVAAAAAAAGGNGGFVMLSRPPSGGRGGRGLGGFSPHSAASMVALSGREALLEGEEEVAL